MPSRPREWPILVVNRGNVIRRSKLLLLVPSHCDNNSNQSTPASAAAAGRQRLSAFPFTRMPVRRRRKKTRRWVTLPCQATKRITVGRHRGKFSIRLIAVPVTHWSPHERSRRLLQRTDDGAVLYEQAQQILRRDRSASSGVERPLLSISLGAGAEDHQSTTTALPPAVRMIMALTNHVRLNLPCTSCCQAALSCSSG